MLTGGHFPTLPPVAHQAPVEISLDSQEGKGYFDAYLISASGMFYVHLTALTSHQNTSEISSTLVNIFHNLTSYKSRLPAVTWLAGLGQNMFKIVYFSTQSSLYFSMLGHVGTVVGTSSEGWD